MKVTVTGILHMYQTTWNAAPSYRIFSSDMSSCSDKNTTYVPIKPVESEFEIPDDFDPRPAIVASLREQKKSILADAHVKAVAIEERIQSILCLEFKEEA